VGEVVAGVAVVEGERVGEVAVVEVGGAALLPVPQPAARRPADSNTPHQLTNFLLVTVLLTLGRLGGFPGGPTLGRPCQTRRLCAPQKPPAPSAKS